MIPFADHFLAGALITLLIPAGVFVAITVWYTRVVLRRAREDERTPGEGPPVAPASEGEASQATL
jgi:hypothetical protein